MFHFRTSIVAFGFKSKKKCYAVKNSYNEWSFLDLDLCDSSWDSRSVILGVCFSFLLINSRWDVSFKTNQSSSWSDYLTPCNFHMPGMHILWKFMPNVPLHLFPAGVLLFLRVWTSQGYSPSHTLILLPLPAYQQQWFQSARIKASISTVLLSVMGVM